GARHLYRMIGDKAERRLDCALHGRPMRQSLPSRKIRAVVFDAERDAQPGLLLPGSEPELYRAETTRPGATPASSSRGMSVSADLADQLARLFLLRRRAFGKHFLEHRAGAFGVTHVEVGLGQVELGADGILA